MKWAELTVKTNLNASEAISNILISEGSGGVASSYLPEETNGLVNIIAYYPIDDRLEIRLERIQDRIAGLSFFGIDPAPADTTIRQTEDEDWAEAWKAYFKPVEIGKIVVKPSWDEYAPKEGQLVLELDPGMAFGTGTHPTTQLCLLMMHRYITNESRVVDFGTGSGILAIAAALLGAKEIAAIDIDPVAVKTATENIAKNNLLDKICTFEADSLRSLNIRPNIIIANIIANTIIDSAQDAYDILEPNGIFISSGIVAEREGEVVSKLKSAGFLVDEISRDGEWIAIASSKRP